MEEKNFLFCFKLSLVAFLLSKNFTFLNKEREVIFDLRTNDGNMTVQNSISIIQGKIVIKTWFPILKNYLSLKSLYLLSNYINVFFENFNSYVEEEKDEEYNLMFIKMSFSPNQEVTVIDDNFWNNLIKYQINNVSNIVDFIYYIYPKSEFFKKRFDTLKFKKYFYNCLSSYLKAIKEIENINKEEELKNEEEIIKHLSEQEINEEIDKELENYSKGNKNERRLDLLVEALNNIKEK